MSDSVGKLHHEGLEKNSQGRGWEEGMCWWWKGKGKYYIQHTSSQPLPCLCWLCPPTVTHCLAQRHVLSTSLYTLLCFFPTWLTLLPWSWRQHTGKFLSDYMMPHLRRQNSSQSLPWALNIIFVYVQSFVKSFQEMACLFYNQGKVEAATFSLALAVPWSIMNSYTQIRSELKYSQ